jgi:glucose/arabinose dehydrogenase
VLGARAFDETEDFLMFRSRSRAARAGRGPRFRRVTAVGAAVGALALVAAACAPPPPPPAGSPTLGVSQVVGGLSVPWDVAWLPDKTLLFTQRASGLYALKNGLPVQLTNGGPDFWTASETGMMGLVVDPQFATNHKVYTCQGSTADSPIGGHPNSAKVAAWQLDANVTTATHLYDVVTGIDDTSGRHGGCQLRFGSDRSLFVGTGDAAYGTNPQNLHSLNGKVLRVQPDHVNAGWVTNPFRASSDPRTRMIYTYGHRNVQGLAFRSNGELWSAEHGPDRDDEINRLRAGDNYGWDPIPLTYNEAVPMTNFGKYPGAAGPQWKSGFPTVATSGITFLSGAQWKQWQGALVVATLKDSRLRVQFYTDLGIFRGEKIPAQFDRTVGRLRAAAEGPDGCLYVTTSNVTNDRILKACPS